MNEQLTVRFDAVRGEKLKAAGLKFKLLSQAGPSGHPFWELSGDIDRVEEWLVNAGYDHGDYLIVL